MGNDVRGVDCPILWWHDWTSCLFSFRTSRPSGIDFVPGQFVRIGIEAADGVLVWRAYSIVSSPAAGHLEFYSIVVPDGPFTQPLARLGVGDSVRIDPTVYGFLRDDRFVGGEQLWLLATGTGIAPFMPMLDDPSTRARYRHIVLVHGVRRSVELAYRETIERLCTVAAGDGARLQYLPTLTADQSSSTALHGRITTLLEDGQLERAAGLDLSIAASRLMICGNPSMIKDVRALLAKRGMTPVRRETPGQFISENFW